ncbi:phage tail tube protein [Brevundimonas sp.]|uniref:phage tail tube protein n=1 Tax=Brevundimonas sp. TaxID=1871086 RepID=UPI0025BD9195|nr:phage tail tube protein [Brevundimonas sp.]
MNDVAAIGNGTEFQIESATPGTFTTIAEVTDITPPNETVNPVTYATLASPYMKALAGLIDPGEASFEMTFQPGSASETLIVTTLHAREAKTFRIVFPNLATWTFSGIVTGYEPAVPNDDRMTASVTIKVSGAVLRENG